MLDPLIDLLNSRTPIYQPFGSILVIAGLFGLAWLVARSSGWVALRVLAWHDGRQSDGDLEATGKMVNLKRRETLVSIIKAGVIYVAFAAAIVLSIGQLAGGVDRPERRHARGGTGFPVRTEGAARDGGRAAAHDEHAARARSRLTLRGSPGGWRDPRTASRSPP